MDPPDESAQPAAYPSFGSPCKSCGTPDMSNMTWEDGVKVFFSNYFASPRMGPIGYLLGSPYSPLRVELEMPSRNWRDAFEDLLAIDTGGQMIDEENRKAEDAFAGKNRYDIASQRILATNHLIQDTSKLEREFLEMRKDILANGEQAGYKPGALSRIEKTLLPEVRAYREALAASGQRARLKYEAARDASASSQKPRGQWIASLMTSGALPGWTSAMVNTLSGPLLCFNRHNAPPELDASVAISERELNEVFDDKQPHGFGSPERIPSMQIRALANGSLIAPDSEYDSELSRRFKPGPLSIHAQTAGTDPYSLPDGSRGFRVSIFNVLVNGTVVTKTYAQQPAQVLEEVENAIHSMSAVREFLEESQRASPSEGRTHTIETT
ncbi:MAG: hypothetical protein Q9222_000801 [Ikaeria aurantiellina]